MRTLRKHPIDEVADNGNKAYVRLNNTTDIRNKFNIGDARISYLGIGYNVIFIANCVIFVLFSLLDVFTVFIPSLRYSLIKCSFVLSNACQIVYLSNQFQTPYIHIFKMNESAPPTERSCPMHGAVSDKNLVLLKLKLIKI